MLLAPLTCAAVFLPLQGIVMPTVWTIIGNFIALLALVAINVLLALMYRKMV